jgi:hypothetical protein
MMSSNTKLGKDEHVSSPTGNKDDLQMLMPTFS